MYADGEPSASNPYVAPPTISLDAVRVNYTQYYDTCNQVSPSCLEAAWRFLRGSEAATEAGVTCVPPERTEFISELYDNCYRKYPETIYMYRELFPV